MPRFLGPSRRGADPSGGPALFGCECTPFGSAADRERTRSVRWQKSGSSKLILREVMFAPPECSLRRPGPEDGYQVRAPLSGSAMACHRADRVPVEPDAVLVSKQRAQPNKSHTRKRATSVQCRCGKDTRGWSQHDRGSVLTVWGQIPGQPASDALPAWRPRLSKRLDSRTEPRGPCR